MACVSFCGQAAAHAKISAMFLTIPTLMTWTRIVAIPLIVGVFYLNIPVAQRNLIATVMFMVFAATDWLDGYLARKLNQASSFGAFLDPVADKFLVCAALLVLGMTPWLTQIPPCCMARVNR